MQCAAWRGETFVHAPNSVVTEISEDLVGLRVRDRLSEKEIHIVAAVVRGYKNREIAMHLYTTEQTIKNGLREIFDKVGVSDRLELALFVLHHRMLAYTTAAVGIDAKPPRLKRGGVGSFPDACLPSHLRM